MGGLRHDGLHYSVQRYGTPRFHRCGLEVGRIAGSAPASQRNKEIAGSERRRAWIRQSRVVDRGGRGVRVRQQHQLGGTGLFYLGRACCQPVQKRWVHIRGGGDLIHFSIDPRYRGYGGGLVIEHHVIQRELIGRGGGHGHKREL